MEMEIEVGMEIGIEMEKRRVATEREKELKTFRNVIG